MEERENREERYGQEGKRDVTQCEHRPATFHTNRCLL